MRRRVCHVTSVHRAKDTRIFYKECVSLSKNYDVYLVVANAQNEQQDGVNIIGVELPKSRLKRRLSVTKKYLPILMEIDAAVYHFHDPELIPLGKRMKSKGKRVIFDSHEDIPQQLLGNFTIPKIFRKTVSSLYACYEKIMLRKFDALVSVTPMLTKRLKSLNNNTYEITNYPIFKESDDNRKWGKSVSFAGLISRQWMHHQIVPCLKDLDVKYLLAGGFSSNDYYVYMTNLPEWSYVDYKGKISHTDVVSLLQESSVGMALIDYIANVGYHEGTLGNTKLFEYMLAGIPVIATDLRLWKEILDEFQCGICVNPNNHDEIVNAINFFIQNPKEAKKMGDNGLKAVREKYNWSTQERILLNMYKDILQ